MKRALLLLAAATALWPQAAPAPDEVVAVAAGNSPAGDRLRSDLAASAAPESAILLRLAQDTAADLPTRRRAAIFTPQIAAGTLTYQAALKLAADPPRYFAALVDLRAPDRLLENESLLLVRAARENARLIVSDLGRFRAIDLYALLAYGQAEATPEVFDAIFDRMLAPKWKAEKPAARSLIALLDRSGDWLLRDFASAALTAHRLDAFLSLAGREPTARLARGILQAPDPLKEGMRLSDIIQGAPALLEPMRATVAAESARCADKRCTTIYGLLAARLGMEIGSPYRSALQSSENLDLATLFPESLCVQRHFFYDDEDGINSFESFLASYRNDPAWTIEPFDTYVHLTGRNPNGRRIEIYANVPIDGHLPQNRSRDEEAARRQQVIAGILADRHITTTVIVHRGHSFWTGRTIGYVTPAAKLVILGSCGGLTQVHRVIEASHDSQVIATRGIGETRINDGILKALNTRLLQGEPVLRWSTFWNELAATWGKTALFRDYLAPHHDSATVFLRAYYRSMN